MLSGMRRFIQLEDLFVERCKDNFPALDAKEALYRYMYKMHEDSRRAGKILMLMRPEVLRVAQGG